MKRSLAAVVLALVLAPACAAQQASPAYPAHYCHDALTMFASGKSLGDIQKQLALADTTEARALVHDAMIELQRRYFHAE